MTTDNRNIDTTGAEANKPESQNNTSQNVGGTQDVEKNVEQPVGSATTGSSEQQSAPEVAKEAQPEMQPELTSQEEKSLTEEKTEAYAAATTDVSDPVSAPASEPASGPSGPPPDAVTSEGSSIPTATSEPNENTNITAATSASHADEEEHEDEDDHVDYSQLSINDLRKELNSILKSADARKKHRVINELNRQYDLRFQEERSEALERFKQEGGTDEDFDYHPSTEHQSLEKLLTAYRDARSQERMNAEEQRQRNLQRKQELLTKLRELVESAETKNSSDELKKLQSDWKSIGPVPAGEAQELWDSYHALLDIFYNNRSIFFELKELDRKRNLDAKLQLIERAEALAGEESINKALQELRHLHEEWKNIGPVPNDQRDPIWERFIQASEKVHERRRAYQEERQGRETENLAKKRILLERLESFQNFNTDRINEWRDKTDEIQKLKDEWEAAGLVPKQYAETVNKSFWGSYKAFFQHKNQFFKGLDEQKMQNLRIKTELCEEAESLKDSTDWNTTKEKLIQLQKKWKTIGRVPDKYSDKIWQRFRAACNEFFDRKQTQEQQRGAEQERLSAERMEICDRVSDKLSQPNVTGSVEEFEDFVAQWRSLDKSNRRTSTKNEEKFLVLMERYLEIVPELTFDERNNMLIRLQVDRLKQSPDAGQKLHQREQTVRREISQLQNDIQTLRTNIGFFARSKNADKLREEYEGRIADAQKRMDQLNLQLEALRG
ncbi:DUF349 domain-containing protein [Pontibacter silvestris]|uniref:DUF349 domain-containing protein n=1 Tax=Pontibacter silvestris TaxID=2305183 RepID=A0ABW4WYJ2_9BACT|nr:DUF349 domain-containing protein [Pontibacter silvestris]MCC9135368.1 DUF349 domain-containing protein [Pontibacter silvestris]